MVDPDRPLVFDPEGRIVAATHRHLTTLRWNA